MSLRNPERFASVGANFENFEVDQKPLLESHLIQQELEQFENGPLPRVACTEKGFLIAYVICLLLSVYFAYTGFFSGDSSFLKLIGDADGNSCGNSIPSHPFLYFPNLLNDAPLASAQRVCVSECPSFNYTEIAYLTNPEQNMFLEMNEDLSDLTYYNLENYDWEEEIAFNNIEDLYVGGQSKIDELFGEKIKGSVLLDAITFRKHKKKGGVVYNKTLATEISLRNYSHKDTAVIAKNQPKYTVEISESALETYRSHYTVDCVLTTYTKYCSQNLDTGFMVYDSNPFISICYPLNPALVQRVSDFTSMGYFNKFLGDIYSVKGSLYILSFGTWVFSLAFVMICQLFPGFVLWSSSFGIAIILILIGFLVGQVATKHNPILQIVPNAYFSFWSYKDYFIAEVFCYIFGVFTLYMILQYRRVLVLSQELVKVASEFYKENKRILLIPGLVFLIQLGLLSMGLSTTIFIYTSGVPKVAIEGSPYAGFSFSFDIIAFFGLIISASTMFWSISIAQAIGDYIIIASTCKWYFNKRAMILSNSYNALRYHFGSLALYGLMTFPFVLVIKIYELVMVRFPGFLSHLN